jgi:acetoin utilization protein AcuB
MTAIDLIAHDIPALKIEQTGRDAFHLLSDHHVKHLPVIDGNRLVGILSEEDVFNHKLYEPVSEYNFSMMRTFSVHSNEHLFEIMRIMGENRLTIIPVTDIEGNYMGMVSQNMLLRAFSITTAFAMPGGILIIELDRRDYSLTTIARAVEEEGAKVLTSIITSTPDSEVLELTLKVNRDDVTRIAAALERYGFSVKRTFAEDDYSAAVRERYDSFMNYLNV